MDTMIKKSGVSYCPSRNGLKDILCYNLEYGYYREYKNEFAEKLVQVGEILAREFKSVGLTTSTLYISQRNIFGLFFYPDLSKENNKLSHTPYFLEVEPIDREVKCGFATKQVFNNFFLIRIKFNIVYDNLSCNKPPYSLNIHPYNTPTSDDFNWWSMERRNTIKTLENMIYEESNELTLEFPTNPSELTNKLQKYIPIWKQMKDIAMSLYTTKPKDIIEVS